MLLKKKQIVSGIRGGVLFYIKMHLGSLLVNYFCDVEPSRYTTGLWRGLSQTL